MQNSMPVFFLLFSVAHFTNWHRFSFLLLAGLGKPDLHTQTWRWKCHIFLPSGVTLLPLGSSFKNSSVCLVPLLSQIQFPFWLAKTEISFLYSRAVHPGLSFFYISHAGVCQFELYRFHKVFIWVPII
jgi:hypothetical protein